MIKALCVSGVVAAAVVLSAPMADAADDRNCSDFSTPIIIVNGFDPAHLDADHDGIGCEANPGQPVASDLYADLRDGGDTNPAPTLAHTGGNIIQRHPIRAYGAAGLLVLGGAATMISVQVARRRPEGE